MSQLPQLPKINDYYYHYKHNADKGIFDYAYKIIGIATHSESLELVVVYQPLYVTSNHNQMEVDFWVRPLTMFIEDVSIKEYNYQGLRFKLITDSDLIQQLQNQL